MELLEIAQNWGWAIVIAYWLMKVAFPALFKRLETERDAEARREANVEDRLYTLLMNTQAETKAQLIALDRDTEQRMRELAGVLRDEIRTNMHNVSACTMSMQYEVRDLRVAIVERLPRTARTRENEQKEES